METKRSIRGSISGMEVNDVVSFTYDEGKPSYIRKTAYEVGVDMDRLYRVEARRGTGKITVTRNK